MANNIEQIMKKKEEEHELYLREEINCAAQNLEDVFYTYADQAGLIGIVNYLIGEYDNEVVGSVLFEILSARGGNLFPKGDPHNLDEIEEHKIMTVEDFNEFHEAIESFAMHTEDLYWKLLEESLIVLSLSMDIIPKPESGNRLKEIKEIIKNMHL